MAVRRNMHRPPVSVSARPRTCPFFFHSYIHRYLSSALEEKRFVSRLTPMNPHGLTPKKMIVHPPMRGGCNFPSISRARHECTRQGVRVWIRIYIYARGTLPRSFLGNIISLGVIERPVVSIFAVSNKCLSAARYLVASCYRRQQFRASARSRS